MEELADDATRHLAALVEGDPGAADKLLPLVYSELRGLAGRYMLDERSGHTLQPTALVHEAYLRLIRCTEIDWRGRAHFFAMAARTLRRVLIDHARGKRATKRGSGVRLEPLPESGLTRAGSGLGAVEIDDALERLAELSERQARVVELRFFAGLSVDETAEVLGLSRDRVKGDTRFARAWLRRQLGPGEEDGG